MRSCGGAFGGESALRLPKIVRKNSRDIVEPPLVDFPELVFSHVLDVESILRESEPAACAELTDSPRGLKNEATFRTLRR